jgi:hypothetical protein
MKHAVYQTHSGPSKKKIDRRNVAIFFSFGGNFATRIRFQHGQHRIGQNPEFLSIVEKLCHRSAISIVDALLPTDQTIWETGNQIMTFSVSFPQCDFNS